MKFICIYTDLNNPAHKTKAIIEADEIEIVDSADENSTLITLVKKSPKATKGITVFLIQEYRIVELYATALVETTPLEKVTQQKRLVTPYYSIK